MRKYSPWALLLSLALAACSGPRMAEEIGIAQSAPPPSLVRGDIESVHLAERLSHEYLNDPVLALAEGAGELWTHSVTIDPRNKAHVRVMQTVDNVPIVGGQSIVHLNRHGLLESVTDGFIRDIDVNTAPVYRDYEAIDLAVDMQGGWDLTSRQPAAELMILRREDRDYLAYRVRIAHMDPRDPRAPSLPVIFLDAHTGEEIWRYDNLQSVRDRETYHAMNSDTLPGVFARGETSPPTGNAPVDAAHDNAGVVYDFYDLELGRDSYDDQGATIISSAHYLTDYNGSFWDGQQVVYGSGDGVEFDPLPLALDIVAHELAHAVTDHTSALIYSGESGAISEAMSDIFAAAIQHWEDNGRILAAGSVNDPDIWRIGEDVYTPGIPDDGIRDMADPAVAGNSDNYPDRYRGALDNYGVHKNSGIASLAFHLMVNGGSHPRGKNPGVVVTPIGMNKAINILYHVQSNYLLPFSNLENLRYATAQAASELSSGSEANAVHEAWDAVGVPGGPSGSNPGPGECLSSFERHTGTLASAGDQTTEPGGSYYFSPYGYQEATLEGPAGSDFNLYLLRWNGTSWITVAESATADSSYELINYLGYSSYYAWIVESATGSGDYTLCLIRP